MRPALLTAPLALLGLIACGDKAEDSDLADDGGTPETASGETAPDFTLIDAAGTSVSLSDTNGTPRLILGTAGW